MKVDREILREFEEKLNPVKPENIRYLDTGR